MQSQPFVIERTFNNVSAHKVWDALTDSQQMKQWYFDIVDFKAEEGFEFQFSAGDGAKQYVHHCRVLEVVPDKKLSYSWSYEGFEGRSVVTFELFEVGNGTKVQLTHEGLESFAVNNDPAFEQSGFEAGWVQIIGRSLKEFVEK